MRPNEFFVLLGLLGACSGDVGAAVQAMHMNSGIHNSEGSEPRLAFSAIASATNGLTRIRIHFSEHQFGARSYARLQSIHDGQEQRLDAVTMRNWSDTSAMFNGSAVRVELYVAPGDEEVFFVADSIIGEYAGGGITDPGWQGPTPGAETLCGADNRVASTDNRVGRFNGNCTGWLISNGGVLTAGHCNIAPGSIFEVNVPASQANGTTASAAMQDQFPVIAGSITIINNGPGNDWTVCRLNTNNLGQYAHEVHGFFRMTRELPAAGQTLRVTGCGVDVSPQGTQPTVCAAFNSLGTCTHFGPNAQNQTLQTSTGDFAGANGSLLKHAVDAEPANSGSPIIWEGNGFAIGIHTHGGCLSDGGANNGTWLGLNTLGNVIAGVPGPHTA